MKRSPSTRSSRREFLLFSAGLATAGLGVPGLFSRNPADAPSEASLNQVTRSAHALGTQVSITALHADQFLADLAIEEAFAELHLMEGLLSIYRPESQLSVLNRERVVNHPHPIFVEVLQAAERMSRRSQGAFDITIQPLWSLFADAKQRGELPTEAEIEAARRRIDWRQVEATSDQVRLHGDAKITLNGIAQGYAADRVEAALRKHGITQALINTGEINGLGTKSEDSPWSVGVQHPREQDAYLSLVDLAGRCLATSGDYATKFSEDHEHHHLFDPRTGCSPTELSSVSILASSAMAADALSTAVFVLGVERGLELVRTTEGADALLVLKNGRMLATDGFPFQA